MTDPTNDIAGLVGMGIVGAVGIAEMGIISNLAEHVTEAGTRKPKKKNHNIESQEWLDLLF